MEGGRNKAEEGWWWEIAYWIVEDVWWKVVGGWWKVGKSEIR